MRFPTLLLGLALTFVSWSFAAESSPPRERVSFNDGWRFARADDPGWTSAQFDYAVMRPWLLASSAQFLGATSPRFARPAGNIGADLPPTQPGFDDSAWRRLDLPHDWGIEGPFRQDYPGETGKLPWWGVAWYRKHFTSPASDADRRVVLEIDGAMAYSAVWLNGHFVGGWPYGYTSYQLDLTPWLRVGGDNVLAVRLDNPPDSSRWYPGGGLYRNVWLTRTSPVHVAPWGAFVTTPRISPESATVSINLVTENDSDADAELTFTTELFALDADGRPSGSAVAVTPPATAKVPARRQHSTTQVATVANPPLWSVDHPNLLVAVTTIRAGERVVDRRETTFGIRTAVFDADRGFLLNGQRVPIRGVCLHHDLGALGTAIHVRALERQLQLLRSMGCNALRTSHNPPAPELLDLCDRLGFLVMDEAFDSWAKGKKRHDYHALFTDWHEQDLRALVRRDRNHPSVILWSFGNEVQDQHDSEGWKLGAHLASIIREEDRTRPLSTALDGIASGYNGLQLVVDAMGYNYKPWEYAKFHAAFPTIPIYGSETASTLSSRGEYFFPLSADRADRSSRVNFQVSSYDNAAETWATLVETEWRGQDAGDYVAGEFVWTGFDYLGESTPYLNDSTAPLNFTDAALQAKAERELKELGRILVPSRSSYFGIFDLAGFPKDRFYLYQSRWRPDLPMAHLLPHWTWPERVGEITPVHVYTSGDSAELFLNGHSLGRKTKAAGEYRLRWDDVRYEPGELKVTAYRNGQPWAEDVVQTAGPAARLQLTADRAGLHADGRDLAYVSVAILDARGVPVPRASDRVTFTVDGPAELVATDNGDPTNLETFSSPSRAAFHGRVLAIVRPRRGTAGAITVRATAPGLAPAEVALRSQ